MSPQSSRSSLVPIIFFVLVICGQPAWAQIYPAVVHAGSNLDLTGFSVARTDDMNGDGIHDFIVGAPGADVLAFNAGQVLVLSGLDGGVIHQVDGTAQSMFLGQVVAGISDVNGDSIPDFIAGSFSSDSMGTSTRGHISLFSGLNASLLYSIDGNNVDGEYGRDVAVLGDVDFDGVEDFAVSSPSDNTLGTNSGAVRVYSGASGNLIHVLLIADLGKRFGWSIAAAGDVNGDGVVDLVAGAPLAGGSGFFPNGKAFVFSGSTGLQLTSHIGPQTGEFLGNSVSAAGDVNSDGFADYAVSSTLYDSGSLNSVGEVKIYSGLNGSVLRSYVGTVAGEQLGGNIQNVGDFDGDGFDDLLLQKRLVSPLVGVVGAKVEIRSGATGGILMTMEDTSGSFTSFGSAVDTMGDLNQDGSDDFVFGYQPSAQGGGSFFDDGLAQVFLAPGPVVRRVNSQGVQPRLALTWVPDLGNPQSLTGTIHCSHATPGAIGLIVASLGDANQVFFGHLPVQVNVAPALILANANFGFDFVGAAVFANLTRQMPSLAGLHSHVQVFELAPIISASNSLIFEIAP